ncbi:MAG: SRPBCC family protein, partial [Armatimonadota bacterium]|nr:SRPBCC family protein [Armatimonadota bacterium]
MKLQRLERVVRLRASLDDVWEFFADPRNLREITPPWLDLQIVSPVPDRMYPGLLIEYRVRPFPGPAWVWVTEITHVQEGVRFVDEQRIGPYRLWHHEHHFRASGHGVEVRDLVVSTCSPEAGPGTWRSDGPCARGFRR